MIRLFYKVFDRVALIIVRIFVDVGLIDRTIRNELSAKKNPDSPEQYEYHIQTLQDRVSALIGHISIMIAVLTITLRGYASDSVAADLIRVELGLYLFIAICCLRCLRAYGFETSFESESYHEESKQDLVLRFGLFRLVNFVAIVATIAFVLTVSIFPPTIS